MHDHYRVLYYRKLSALELEPHRTNVHSSTFTNSYTAENSAISVPFIPKEKWENFTHYFHTQTINASNSEKTDHPKLEVVDPQNPFLGKGPRNF